MNDTDTLQAYIERWAESTQLQWEIEDAAAENREWDVEWIYLFILTFALYLAAAAIINKIKQRKNAKEMRTIKFRGKNSRSNQWETGNLVVYENGETRIMYAYRPYATVTSTVIPETVGQFTGLTDKNGKKIYEGDIIHVKGNTFDKDFGVVTYHKNGYFYIDDSFGEFPRDCVKPIGDFFNRISRDDFFQGMNFYVIGNIHDNPELKKGGPNAKPL